MPNFCWLSITSHFVTANGVIDKKASIDLTKYFVSVLDTYRGGRTNHLHGDELKSFS